MPTLTAAMGPPSMVVSSSRAARRRSAVTTISRSASLPPSATSSDRRLRRDPHRVEHRDGARRRRGRPERLQSILARPGREPDDDGHACPRLRPDDVTDARGCDLVVQQARRDVVRQPEHDPASPVLVQVEAGLRHPSGDRRADVDEVAVAVRPRAQHRVGEHDRVRLGPGDVLAERRTCFELVRRAGPGRPAAHRHVRVHESTSPRRRVGVEPDEAGVEEVERGDVQGRRDRDGRPACQELLGEIEPHPAVIQAAVDVR